MNIGTSKARAALLGVPIALASVFSASSASAAVVPITAGITGGSCAVGNTADTSFQFGSINTAGSLAAILNAGNSGSCYNDDKLYTFNFANLANTPIGDDKYSFNTDDVFDILESGSVHTLRVRPLSEIFTPANPAGKDTGTYELNYSVQLLNPPSPLVFDAYATNEDGSALVGTAVSSTRTLTEGVFGTVCDTTQGSCGANPQGKTIPNDNTLLFNFTSSLVVAGPYLGAGTGAVQFSDTVRQKSPLSTVPGPLPILGVSAAFAYTRKLRNRIQQS